MQENRFIMALVILCAGLLFTQMGVAWAEEGESDDSGETRRLFWNSDRLIIKGPDSGDGGDSEDDDDGDKKRKRSRKRLMWGEPVEDDKCCASGGKVNIHTGTPTPTPTQPDPDKTMPKLLFGGERAKPEEDENPLKLEGVDFRLDIGYHTAFRREAAHGFELTLGAAFAGEHSVSLNGLFGAGDNLVWGVGVQYCYTMMLFEDIVMLDLAGSLGFFEYGAGFAAIGLKPTVKFGKKGHYLGVGMRMYFGNTIFGGFFLGYMGQF